MGISHPTTTDEDYSSFSPQNWGRANSYSLPNWEINSTNSPQNWGVRGENHALSRLASFESRYRDFPQYFSSQSPASSEPVVIEDLLNRYTELFFIPKETEPIVPESSELEATVFTDKDDYAPGETATIFGNNFDIGETIELQVLHTDDIPNTGGGHEPWFVTDGGAGDLDGVADGNFETTWYVNPDDSADSAFKLTANSLASGETATHYFTDSDPAVQFFYIPKKEADIRAGFYAVNTNFGLTVDIQTVISITVSTDDSIIYYDHWEDGYETDISNPTQSTTEIWGDNNPDNGFAPGFEDKPDLFVAGDIISLENSVDVANTATVFDFDGEDKIGASKAIVVSRPYYPDAANGELIAEAVKQVI